jgi:cobalt-zinc-cadmium efflux system membrane fusion protein
MALACGTAPAAEETPPATEPGVVMMDESRLKASGVTVTKVVEVERRSEVSAPAVIVADETRTSRIGSIVEGNVLATRVEVGDHVAAGQLLAVLHSHQAHDAWADWRKAVAAERQAAADVEHAARTLARAERLVGAMALARRDLEQARVDHARAEQALTAAQADVGRAVDELDLLGVAADQETASVRGPDVPVTSPIAGVVLEKQVTRGAAVSPGSPLFVVSSLASVWAVAEFDESVLAAISAPAPVSIRTPAYPDRVFRGTLEAVGDTINPRTRRVTARARIPNGEGLLKLQMFATLSLAQGGAAKALLVPADAVQTMDGRTVVFVADTPTRFSVREVTVGPRAAEGAGGEEGSAIVTAGLRPGERVAATSTFLLKSELANAARAREP